MRKTGVWKSQAWVAERSAHLERLLGNVVLLDLTETRIRQYHQGPP
jgi:hypothetical protein